MKYVLLVLSFITCIANAQEIKVKRIKQLTPRDTGEYAVSGVSPDGKKLLVTGPGLKGLYLLNIRSRKAETITEMAGAGYEPVFSPDGRYICFRTDEYSSKLKYSSLHKIDLVTGESETLERKSRNISQPVAVSNNVAYFANGLHQVKGFEDNNLKSLEKETYVLLEELLPVLYINGEKKILKPGGDGSYIWVSLSPDKTKLLYHLVGKGTFISDLNGNILGTPGKLNAPKWLTDQVIIGMNDKDDGDRLISSEIVAFNLTTGKRTNLTSSGERNEMYPFPFPNGKKIAFRTPGGELYLMKVKVR